MFDFQQTLKEATDYEKTSNYPLAAFHYWLIIFAYEDEEFPYSYTEAISSKGRSGFLKMMRKHKNEILNSNEYISFKDQLSMFPSYKNYFANFERVVNSFINKNSKKHFSEDCASWIEECF